MCVRVYVRVVNMDMAAAALTSGESASPTPPPKPVCKSDASRMLEAALQQMDGIISGGLFVYYE